MCDAATIALLDMLCTLKLCRSYASMLGVLNMADLLVIQTRRHFHTLASWRYVSPSGHLSGKRHSHESCCVLQEVTRAGLRLLFNGDTSQWDRAMQLPHYNSRSMPAVSLHSGHHLIQVCFLIG